TCGRGWPAVCAAVRKQYFQPDHTLSGESTLRNLEGSERGGWRRGGQRGQWARLPCDRDAIPQDEEDKSNPGTPAPESGGEASLLRAHPPPKSNPDIAKKRVRPDR